MESGHESSVKKHMKVNVNVAVSSQYAVFRIATQQNILPITISLGNKKKNTFISVFY